MKIRFALRRASMGKRRFCVVKPQYLVPVAIVGASLLLVGFLVKVGPRAVPKPHEAKLPAVSVQIAHAGVVSIPVHARGLVSPVTQIQLMSEVNGTVDEVSPDLATGAFFKKGEVLLRVDPAHNAAELANARANLASAEHALARTSATVKSSGVDLDASRKTRLARGSYQMDEARARLEVARQAVRLAEAQLAKTTVRAPFEGRVAKKLIDAGETATIGRPIAQIYATDAAEVRLPLSAEQFQLVDVPLQYDNRSAVTREPLVILDDATSQYRWRGHVKRSEGFINPTSRLINLIAEIRQPYSQDPAQPDRPPLIAGTFVEATISGRLHDNIVTLPLEALHGTDNVWVLDAQNHLKFRVVKVLYRGRDRAYIAAGLEDGARVVLTPLEVAAENMELAVLGEVPQPQPLFDDEVLSDSGIPASSADAPVPASRATEVPAGVEGMTGLSAKDQEVEP